MCYTLHGSPPIRAQFCAYKNGDDFVSYAVVRMQKMKAHDLKGIQSHNQRERESRTNSDIDKERSHLNYDLVNERSIDYNKRVKEIIEPQKTTTRKIRKDAVLVNELLVTSDREFFDKLSPDETRKFFKDSLTFFQERYGKQNIAYAVVHMDEKTPHLHLGVVPMRDGRLQSKNVFNRDELFAIQDEFPKHMRSLGFELERGEKGSDREHIETNKFKKQTLEKEIKLLEKNLQEKKNELMALSEKVPDEIKVNVKRQVKTVEVPTGERNFWGQEKKEKKKKPTGNVIMPEQDYKNLVHAAKENKQLKGILTNILETDVMRENNKLGKKIKRVKEENIELKTENEELKNENQTLKAENQTLKARISDLRAEIQSIYKSTKEFLKERTKDVRAFKSVFKDFVDKVKEKAPGSEFERLNRVEKRREMDRGMER